MAKEDAKPMGVCEKLFNALSLNPSFRPIRRLTFRENTTDAAANPTQNHSNNVLKTDANPKPAKLPEPKPDRRPPPAMPARAVTEKGNIVTWSTDPTVPVPTHPKQQQLPPPPPAVPIPAPPKRVALPPPEAETEEKKKSINEKAAEYIKNAKIKIRANTFARTHTTKKAS
ncbi:hypothetical protein Cni_G29057 [Canna indica]|uniref:Uncharacterized protein n=1 Tax=Canna indica TaxID=4628 RepID=A0AAQ3L3Z2_9LILI|nr:hypothetical protein Cni_G29057 [Canna indica]